MHTPEEAVRFVLDVCSIVLRLWRLYRTETKTRFAMELVGMGERPSILGKITPLLLQVIMEEMQDVCVPKVHIYTRPAGDGYVLEVQLVSEDGSNDNMYFVTSFQYMAEEAGLLFEYAVCSVDHEMKKDGC